MTNEPSHSALKTLAFVHRNDEFFAVGDFYPVVSVMSHYDLGNTISPFLLLDHIGPGLLKPSLKGRGVEPHPHRGFETVTFVFDGELEHQDSTGAGGVLYAGDVQWMTAASGIIHKEVFSQDFAQKGGRFEMVQLWVNLPKKHKMDAPRYQHLANTDIPVINLDGGLVRVIAGQYLTQTGEVIQGIASTHSPMTVLDVSLAAGQSIRFAAQHLDTTLIYLRRGRLELTDASEALEPQGLAVMSSHGTDVEIYAPEPAKFLFLTGKPLQEPLYGRGFFVMNSFAEIVQAQYDLEHDQFIQKI